MSKPRTKPKTKPSNRIVLILDGRLVPAPRPRLVPAR